MLRLAITMACMAIGLGVLALGGWSRVLGVFARPFTTARQPGYTAPHPYDVPHVVYWQGGTTQTNFYLKYRERITELPHGASLQLGCVDDGTVVWRVVP